MGTPVADRCKVPAAFWRAMERRGLPAATILRQARLPATLPLDDRVLIPTAQFFRLCRAVEDLSGDPGLGLHLVEAADAAVLPPSVLVVLYARDWRDALQRLARFKRLCTPEVLTITEQAGECVVAIHWLHGEGEPPALAADMSLAVLLEIGRRGTGRHLAPRRVDVARTSPVAAVHRAFFGAEVRHGAGRDALVIEPTDLDLPFQGHNREMLDLVTPALAAEMRALEAAGSVVEQVRAVLMERLASGPPDLSDVAADLGLSERTLQRRITDEGTSFRELLAGARRSLGQRLLADPSVEIGEVAFLLGYQDASAFYRAFRDWEGTTPGRWREARAKIDPSPRRH